METKNGMVTARGWCGEKRRSYFSVVTKFPFGRIKNSGGGAGEGEGPFWQTGKPWPVSLP